MKTATSRLPILTLAVLLSIGAGIASAQFRIAPSPSGGFGGAGAFGGIGGLGSPDLGSPGLSNGLGNSGLGEIPLRLDNYVLPDTLQPQSYPQASSFPSSSLSDTSTSLGYSGGSSGGSPPPPDESRWNARYAASSPSEQNRDDTTSRSSNEVRNTPVKPVDATSKEQSDWRWKWWHGVVVLVVACLAMASRKK